MARRIGELRNLLRDAGRPENSVTISLTAPVTITKAAASPRPTLQGRPEDIAADLRTYEGLGVSNININLPGFDITGQVEAMEEFGHEVMPLMG
jgi:hypothetical protein